MKILVLSHMYPSSFNPVAGIFVHEQVKELTRQGQDVRVISPVPWAPWFLGFKKKWREYRKIKRQEVINNIKVYHPRFITFPRAFLFSLTGHTYWWGVRKQVKRISADFPFDLIYAHVALPDGWGGMVVKKIYGKPFLVTVHGLDVRPKIYKNKKCYQRIEKIFKEADAILANSDRTANLIAEIYGENLETKIKIVYNGVSLEDVYQESSPIKRKYDSKKIILSVGNLVKLKGINYLIQALPKIIEKVPNLVCLIIGKGEEKENLKRLVEKFNLENYVEFLGPKPHKEVFEYMSMADVFVLPSINEAFGVVYIEAMAHKVPVIGCLGQGIEDIVENEKSGILVRPKNVEDLENALVKLLTDEDFAHTVGQAGRKIVEEKFTWGNSVRELMEVYSSLRSS